MKEAAGLTRNHPVRFIFLFYSFSESNCHRRAVDRDERSCVRTLSLSGWKLFRGCCLRARLCSVLYIPSSVTLIMTLTYAVVKAFMDYTPARLKRQFEWGHVCIRLCYLYACVCRYSAVHEISDLTHFPVTLSKINKLRAH